MKRPARPTPDALAAAAELLAGRGNTCRDIASYLSAIFGIDLRAFGTRRLVVIGEADITLGVFGWRGRRMVPEPLQTGSAFYGVTRGGE